MGECQAELLRVFPGDSEMAQRMRAHDWSRSAMGPVQSWPENLRVALSICLSSRFPMHIWWGPQLTLFYNDAYIPFLGPRKHPAALGRCGREAWTEIWSTIDPMIERVFSAAEANWSEDILMFFDRRLPQEEVYVTFSFSPVFDRDGRVAGMYCACSESTGKIVGARRLETLRRLGEAAEEHSALEACARSALALAQNPYDIPYAALYRVEEDRGCLSLSASAGLKENNVQLPLAVSLDAGEEVEGGWPLLQALKGRSAVEFDLVGSRAASAGDAWPYESRKALILPIRAASHDASAGLLVVGAAARIPFDQSYREFFNLVAGQIGRAIADASAYELERKRAEALAEIDRAKTTFFSNVSHEFRTPITLMLGPLEDMLGEEGAALPPAHVERVGMVYRNGLRLLKLVNTLLDFSRIQAGRIEACYRATDLATTTADLASNFRSAFERAAVDFSIECPPLPQPVLVDRDMWEKIVLNLLSNAFKFTLAGQVRVQLSHDERHAHLIVADTGVGIPEAELPRIFERFHRIESTGGRTYEGSGIGLSLVKELVELHGGTITVRSELERGSEFQVSVPFGSAHLDAARIDAAPMLTSTATRAEAYVQEALRWIGDEDEPQLQAERSLRGFRVLVADDNADMRLYLRTLLSPYGEVHLVADGAQAIAALERSRYDLLLSDVMMPKVDGFALLRHVRSSSQLQLMAVILLSARAGEEARAEGLQAGADDYLVKPFSARDLVARIGACLAVSRLRADALAESEALLRALIGGMPQLMWRADTRGEWTWSSPQWTAYTGLTSEFSAARGWLVAVHPADVPKAEDCWSNAQRSGILELELRLCRCDGGYRWFLLRATPIRSQNGTVIEWIGTASDIEEQVRARDLLTRDGEVLERRVAERTAELHEALLNAGRESEKRKRAEERLLQGEKLKAIGQLTGGIAHDFNNMLQALTMNLRSIHHLIARDRLMDVERNLERAESIVKRAALLTHRLLAFGRQQSLEPRPTQLGRIVRDMEDMIRHTVGPSIQLEVCQLDVDATVMCDVNQIENALLNLCVNARDAMPDGGVLTITTGLTLLSEAEVADYADVKPGGFATLAVSDTGTGIPAEVQAHIFEPYFTTKAPGQGTGLGLSQIYGFVHQSGGIVQLETELGRGTLLRLCLPIHYEDEAPKQPERERQAVLLVEDDDDIRELAGEQLREAGCRVLLASSAGAALRFVQSGTRIDLLVTDVGLPGRMDGRQLVQRIRERYTDLPVIYISGYAAGQQFAEGELLLKPFEPEALLDMVKRRLNPTAVRFSSFHASDECSPAAARYMELVAAPSRVAVAESSGAIDIS